MADTKKTAKKAEEYLTILSKREIGILKTRMNKGGVR